MENVECSVPDCDGTSEFHKLRMPSYKTITVKPEDLEYKGDLLSQIIDAQRAAAFENRPPVVLPKGIDTGFYEAVAKVFTDAESVLLKKHRDYGPTNISRSPGGPLNGLRVRMWDKLARINNLIDSGAEPENESLRDSFLDLMNYAAIAQVVLGGNWPES